MKGFPWVWFTLQCRVHIPEPTLLGWKYTFSPFFSLSLNLSLSLFYVSLFSSLPRFHCLFCFGKIPTCAIPFEKKYRVFRTLVSFDRTLPVCFYGYPFKTYPYTLATDIKLEFCGCRVHYIEIVFIVLTFNFIATFSNKTHNVGAELQSRIYYTYLLYVYLYIQITRIQQTSRVVENKKRRICTGLP